MCLSLQSSTRLDYRNALLFGLPKNLINKLQCVQKSTTRIVCYKCKYDHISPVVRWLYWLPIDKCIIFKILLLNFKCQNDLAPQYLSDLSVTQESVHGLCSNKQGFLVVPCLHQMTYYGDRKGIGMEKRKEMM